MDPSTGIRLLIEAQRRDERQPERIHLDMEFAEEGGEGPTPYETLFEAALAGDHSHFIRQDIVEESWRIVQPLLEAPPPVRSYRRGTWGPAAARTLLPRDDPWREPWLTAGAGG
jgi:glucose-6-phosphate 1-dehydrogenase